MLCKILITINIDCVKVEILEYDNIYFQNQGLHYKFLRSFRTYI